MSVLQTKYGPWALITGASSGMGEQFAYELARQGFHLVLVARRKDKLEEIQQQILNQHKVDVVVLACDLTDTSSIQHIIEHTDGLEVNLLINNAGFATTGEFVENPLEKELSLIQLNCVAPIALTHHFANKMKERRKGGILFTSSMVSYHSMPYWANYSASKAYIRYIAEALYFELLPYQVDVMSLNPGGINTEFASVANVEIDGMDARSVVRHALTAMGKRVNSIPGFSNKARSFALKYLPFKLSSFFVLQTMKKVAGK